jgi:hypothetical protein
VEEERQLARVTSSAYLVNSIQWKNQAPGPVQSFRKTLALSLAGLDQAGVAVLR